MPSTTRPTFGATPAPSERPPREALLEQMLTGTKRGFVPIRRTFLQKPRGAEGSRGAQLAKLAANPSALNAYLLLHALASSSEPYQADYPVATWVDLLCLEDGATEATAKSRWSKVITKLNSLDLIERRRVGNSMQYLLLDESGNKTAYTRPQKAADGNYFKLPYSYWANGYDVSLDQSERLMLLIGLDQQDGFVLPFNQARQWYGVSESTARRGLRGLEARDLLVSTSKHVPSAKSPTGWAESIKYTMTEPFSRKAIAKLVKDRGKTLFAASPEPRP
ncbi:MULTISPECIES: hypothetical protein [Clavibacter]|nr:MULTISPECIES: hypothetical protein [Clavibacter]MDA3805260.1 hypothetical protein [Clavibacter sp. CT19]